jgi:serine/threonine protein kinase
MSESEIPGYIILKKIAKGGMARVFVAIQAAVGRTIALKILSKKYCEGNGFTSLFLREANCGVLNHPNIITIYDAGETDSHLYIAMEYLQGGDLKKKIKAGLSQEETIKIVIKLSEALAYAHSKGFVHRDIKPGNIIFNDDKQPILTDFGIAGAIGFSEATLTGDMMLGTPYYISPEQASSDKVDHRTDLYSLGVVYYEMLTGKKIFTADTPFALIYKHLEEAPPNLDKKFIEHQPIIHKLLSKKAADRYASAFDLIEDLAKLTSSKNEQAAIRSARIRTYKNVAVLITLVLSLSVILSDNVSGYTQKQFADLKSFAAQAAERTKAYLNELEKQKIIVAEQEDEIQTLNQKINKNKDVLRHLNKAAHYMRERQYIKPRFASALTEYRSVLSIDPDNVQAKSGIGFISDYYFSIAKYQASKGANIDALENINNGLIASPNNDKFTRMRFNLIKKMEINRKRIELENELLLVKGLIKNGNYEQALKKLKYLQTISKKNTRILTLLSIVEGHL